MNITSINPLANQKILPPVAVSKTEIEVERHVLSTTVKLSDGSEGRVISRGTFRSDSNMLLYNCHLCGVANLPGERCLQTHMTGRKHQAKMRMPKIDANQFRAPLSQKSKFAMHIAPGEPVPPGFENEVKPVAEIQSTIDQYKEQPLVGLDYTIELRLTNNREPVYNCILCDTRGDMSSIMIHLISQNHRLKYLEKHFASCMDVLNPYRYNRETNHIMKQAVQYVCSKIEDRFGRSAPSVHDMNEYNRNRVKINQEINADRHIDEQTTGHLNLITPDFVENLLRQEDKKLFDPDRSVSPPVVARNRQHRRLVRIGGSRSNELDEISSDSSVEGSHNRSPSRKKARGSRMMESFYSHCRSRSPSSSSKNSRVPFTTSREIKKSTQPKSSSADNSKWEKFRKSVEQAVSEMEKKYKEFEQNPEKHPMYSDEWKKFWSLRYKELLLEKKDPNTYDYKPEWIIYWTGRMKDLHNSEIEVKKKEIRIALKLPPENSGIIDLVSDRPLPGNGASDISDLDDFDEMDKKSSRNRDAKSSRGREDRKGRDYDHKGSSRSSRRSKSRDRDARGSRRSRSREDYKKSSRRSRSRDAYKKSSRRSRSREIDHKETLRGQVFKDSWNRNNIVQRSRSREPEKPKPQPPVVKYEITKIEDGPVNLVTVCRLLSAIEEDLGERLGSRITELLRQSLLLEKNEPNSADEALLTEKNCEFFEVIKEKLKGRLIACVVPTYRIQAVKRAIQNIATMIYDATKRREEKLKEEREKQEEEERKLREEKQKERLELANQIMQALIEQGKLDTTPEELEEIVKVYSVMMEKEKAEKEEAEKEKNKPAIVDITGMDDIEKEFGVCDVPEVPVETCDVPKPPEPEKETKKPQKKNTDSDGLNALTDSDLKTLLINFRDLVAEERDNLITYLREMEKTDPERVEKLKKYVVVDDESQLEQLEQEEEEEEARKKAIEQEKPVQPVIQVSDDEDDYTFDDIVKNASKQVRQELDAVSDDSVEEVKTENTNTKNLIANLMGSFQNTVRKPEPEPLPNIPGLSTPLFQPNSIPLDIQNNFFNSLTAMNFNMLSNLRMASPWLQPKPLETPQMSNQNQPSTSSAKATNSISPWAIEPNQQNQWLLGNSSRNNSNSTVFEAGGGSGYNNQNQNQNFGNNRNNFSGDNNRNNFSSDNNRNQRNDNYRGRNSRY